MVGAKIRICLEIRCEKSGLLRGGIFGVVGKKFRGGCFYFILRLSIYIRSVRIYILKLRIYKLRFGFNILYLFSTFFRLLQELFPAMSGTFSVWAGCPPEHIDVT